MQAQAKYTNTAQSSTPGGGGRVTFAVDKKCSADRRELNTIITSALANPIELTKKDKERTKDDYDSEDEVEHFNFEELNFRANSES